MKNEYITRLIGLLVLLANLPVYAYDFESGGLHYSISGNNTVSVVGPKDYSGDIVIPDQVVYNGNFYSVTSINDAAFAYWPQDFSTQSVTIPRSITSIGYGAFEERSGLNAVYITDLEAWCNISFHGSDSNPLEHAHHLFLNGQEITDLRIPNSVSSIASYAFWGGKGFTSMTIPNTVTSIGDMAFYNCSGLITIVSEIEIPFAIGDSTFPYNSAELIVPKGTKALYQATEGWNKFTKITEAEGEVEVSKFFVDGIYYEVNTDNRNEVTVVRGDVEYSGDIIIPEKVTYSGNTYSVTKIRYSAFTGSINLTSVIMPNSITELLGEDTFANCHNLASVTISNRVTHIPAYTFEFCISLANVIIPNSVTSIGRFAFWYCSSATTIVSEIEKPFEIYSDVFSGIPSDAELIVPKGTKALYLATEGWNKFANITEAAGEEEVSEFSADGIYYKVGENNTVSVTFGDVKYSGDVVIPSQVTYKGKTYSVTSIVKKAFSGCSGLFSVSIPNSIKIIGEYNQEIKGKTNVEIIPVSA